MVDRNDMADTNKDSQKQNFAARRRLLKASAAVPLIGTLAPGSTLAATSTQCDLEKGDSSSWKNVTSYDDNALRARAHYWKSTNYNYRSDCYEIGDKFYDADTGQQIYPTLRYGVPRGYSDGGTRYVLAYVEVSRYGETGMIDHNDVRIAGVYPQRQTGGYAMSDSCWDSIGGIKNVIYDQANG